MRKNNMLAVLAIAMAVTVGATACGAKDTTKSTEASQETSTEASVADTEQDATESVKADETKADESTEETTEEETTEEETAPDVGKVDAGMFVAKSGKYQIALPKDWTVDGDSDESITTFNSPSGNDYLEVTYVEGDDAADELENYPATKEEYKNLISRGEEDLEITKYDVKSESNGSKTFRYAITYKNPEDGVRYYAVSGVYDAAAKKYIMAAGTVESEGSDVASQIEASLDSLKLK